MSSFWGMILEFVWSIADVFIIVNHLYQIIVNGNTNISQFILLGFWLFILPYNAVLAYHYFKEYFEEKK